MKQFKKAVTTLAVLAMLGSSAHSLHAQDYCVDNEGCAYEDCCDTSCTTPYIALAAIAAVAIVAICVSDSGHHHGGHSHAN